VVERGRTGGKVIKTILNFAINAAAVSKPDPSDAHFQLHARFERALLFLEGLRGRVQMV